MYAYRIYNPSMKRISLFLPEPMIARLGNLSKKTGTPSAELIRRAIEAYLRKEEK
jgi:predicted DNA-binding protein